MKINKRFIVFIMVAVVFTGLLFHYLHRAPKRDYSDFRVYYATAQRFADKGEIYSRPDISITPYKYSPTFAMILAPLSLFSKKGAAITFFVINFLCLVAIFVFSKRLIIKSKISFKQNLFLCIITLIFTSRFIIHVLDVGQVGLMILALVVFGLYLLEKRKEWWASALIGLSVMIKYTSIIFLPYFLVRKRFRVIALIILCIMLYCVAPAIYVGIDKHTDYLTNWLPSITKTSLDKGSWYDYKNQSIFSVILRFFTKGSPYKISIADLSFNQGLAIAIILGAIIYLLIIFPKGKNGNKPIEYSLLFLCTALFNPNAWMHNFVVLIFAYITLIYYLIKVNFKDKATIALVFLSFVLTSWMGESLVGNNLENLFEELSSVAIGVFLLVIALLRLKYKNLFAPIHEE